MLRKIGLTSVLVGLILLASCGGGVYYAGVSVGPPWRCWWKHHMVSPLDRIMFGHPAFMIGLAELGFGGTGIGDGVRTQSIDGWPLPGSAMGTATASAAADGGTVTAECTTNPE